jgi:probable HAF family extracellular repeat protein
MRHISCAVLIAAAAYGCGDEAEVTQPREGRAQLAAHARYTIAKFRSLGGTQSRGMAINEQSRVAGWSNQPDGNRRAVLWRNETLIRLPTLGGPMSTVPWPGLNDEVMIVGISQTAKVDPLDEDWSCEFGGFLPDTTNLICRGFVWDNGEIRELPTLGGNHGFAAGVNNKGQVVGWAETRVHDPTCDDESRQVLQFRAVRWELKNGITGKITKRQLRPLRRDSTSAATAINDRGQAVGISGDCDQAVGRFSARHAVLWDQQGKPTEIPNLGGKTWHTPMDINERGDVVGFSNPPGPGDPEGEFIARAFFWRNGAARARNLGGLDDDAFSQALAINERRQVVGVSFGGSTGGARAFLYEDGVLKNLNDLVNIAPDVLLSAQDINDAGRITGRVLEAATGQVLTFVATPVASSP